MKRTLLLATSLALTLSSCALLKDLLTTVFTQPTFRFKSATVRDATLSGVTLDTVWIIDNPNTVGLSLASVDYSLFIDGKQVVAGKPPLGLQIPAEGSAELVFPASVRFLDVVPALQTMLSKDTATWRVEGSIGLDTPVGVVSLPLAAQDTFETPKLPQVQFSDPRVSNLTFSGATVEFPMVVVNRSSFPMKVAVTGTLSIAGSAVGTLSTGDLGTLSGKGSRTVTVPLTLSFISAGSALVSALNGGNANLSFDAKVDSGPDQVPLKVDQWVNFVR